jgi:hypothetical protein
MGFEFFRVQYGLDPNDWKPMTSVGTEPSCSNLIDTLRFERADHNLQQLFGTFAAPNRCRRAIVEVFMGDSSCESAQRHHREL